jgi:hypothetical protein
MPVHSIANNSHGNTSTLAIAAPDARFALMLLSPVHIATHAKCDHVGHKRS